jgi:BirA family transcriptional regulator, biotin operon repressor / biotin---[acetyl-CoA-carboxylase] ligase
MDVDELAERTRLAIEGTRWRLSWVSDTGSTNADLLAAAADGEPAGAVLVAEHQGAGRGRLDRTWVAPEGSSLLMSVLLRPSVPPDAAHLTAVVVALAAEHACTAITGVTPGLKWPNDLILGSNVVGSRKVGGVLSESLVVDGDVTAVVVGIGINVNWPSDLPAELVGVATSLNAHVAGDDDIDRVELLASLLTELDALVDLLDSAPGRTRLLDEYRRRCVTIGRQVRVEMANTAMEGTATGIDDHGRLVVTDDDGDEVAVAVGDVVHLRPVL